MRRTALFVFALLFVFLNLHSASAQPGRTLPQDSAFDGYGNPMVIAAAAKDQVRFSVLALAKRVRLEVLSETGETVYDSGLRPGNLFEWPVTDTQGSQLRDGIYGALVTVEEYGGRGSQRRGVLRVQGGSVTFTRSSGTDRNAAAESDQEELVALYADDVAPVTILSHDGDEGWVESGRGGLSFYAGSLSRSRDGVPHLRLTPEGYFGIGVADPQAKLDVAGTIRASEGFQFSDGTVLKMEGGNPVLVTDNSGSGGGSTSVAGKTGGRTTRVLAASGGTVLACGGTGGRVFGLEGGSPLYNTFYGLSAGASTTTGGSNSFFGADAGYINSTGLSNSFFGNHSGHHNSTGSSNSFFGQNAGFSNTTGLSNSFFGGSAGITNTTGTDNSFLGVFAGSNNTTGSSNSFLGKDSGFSNTVENNNTFLGGGADGFAGVTNATAVGFRAKVTQSNSLVLGSINAVNGASADTKVGIGITAPERRLHVAETGTTATRGVTFDQHSADAFASVFILRKSRNATAGGHGILLNGDALFNFTGQGSDGTKFVDVARIRMEIDGAPGVSDMPGRMTFWTTPDGAASTTERMRIDSNGNVGIGTSAPAERLHVAGNIRYSGSLINAAPDEPVPDYVFEPDYRLMAVEELGQFVAREKHLPNVPSASEIKANGLNLGQFQMKLLEKIEELTLYTVHQAVTIQSQQGNIRDHRTALERKDAEIVSLNSRLAALEQRLERLAREGQK